MTEAEDTKIQEPPDRPGVEPEDSLAEAGRKLLRFQLARMARHEDGTRLGEDIEELHDMRVAVRRMRAVFEVFGPAFKAGAIKPFLKGLRATGRALGRVRDLDVFIEKAQRYLKDLPAEEQSGLDPLFEAWAQEREAARNKMLKYLDSEDFDTFKRKFGEWVNTPGAGATVYAPAADQTYPDQVRYVAPVLVYQRLAGVRAHEARLAEASLEQLHELRLEFKRLRYTLEFFKEVLGPEVKAVIDDLKKMQDHLGDLNDANVACDLLSDFLERWGVQQAGLPIAERRNSEPVVAYLAAKHAERHRLLLSFDEAWAHFHRSEFRENLALAVAKV